MICLTLPENNFDFVAQKFAKKVKGSKVQRFFQRFTTFVFDLKVAPKQSILKIFDLLPHFPHLPHLVAEKLKVKNVILKCSGDWVASTVSF